MILAHRWFQFHTWWHFGPLKCLAYSFVAFFVHAYPLSKLFFFNHLLFTDALSTEDCILHAWAIQKENIQDSLMQATAFYHPSALLSLLQLGRSQLMIVNPGFIWNVLSGQNLRDETLWIRLSFKIRKSLSAPTECFEAAYHNGPLEDFKDPTFIQKKQNLSAR